MKTNHARQFVEEHYDFRDRINWGYTRTLTSGAKHGVCIGSNDFVNGIHGYARSRKGAKHKAIQQDRLDSKEFIRERLHDEYGQ
jgi:hypothetical protein